MTQVGFVDGLPFQPQLVDDFVDWNIDQKFQSSLRGKVGWAGEKAMVCVTGGLAFSQFDYSLTLRIEDGFSELDTFSNNALGYTVGAGAGYMLTKNISFEAEYRYTDYDGLNKGVFDDFRTFLANGDFESSPEGFDSSGEVERSKLDFHTVRARLSYHF